MPEEQHRSLTPKLFEKIKAHQGEARLTWFGMILLSLEIPRRFFPQSWVVRISQNATK
jgi:predicted HTH transcriptional regulator